MLVMTSFRKYLPVLFALLSVTMDFSAQTAVGFGLERHDDGHYYFQAPVCGQQAEIMLESGIPAFLVGRDFYERKMKNIGLEFESSESKMRLLTDVYQISFQTKGKIAVGKAVYDGPIFILDGFDGFSLPIQYLEDAVTGKRVVSIDLARMNMSVGGPVTRQGQKYKLAYEKDTGRPFINSSFTIDGCEFNGKLLVDFGNPMLLFLFRQHRCLRNAVNKGRIELQSAFDGQGRLVSQGFIAKSVNLFGVEYRDRTIGVTGKYKNATELGFLGTPFFDASVVFDFDNAWMYK